MAIVFGFFNGILVVYENNASLYRDFGYDDNNKRSYILFIREDCLFWIPESFNFLGCRYLGVIPFPIV
jgi:predicted ABC-type sugar transport system permease subunit